MIQAPKMPIQLSQYIEKTIDFIFPPRCPLSGQPVDKQGQIHASIWTKMHFITDPCCWNCGYPFDFSIQTAENFLSDSTTPDVPPLSICNDCLENSYDFDMARSAFRYKNAGRDLILLFKHADKTSLSDYLAQWMLQCGPILFESNIDLIIPVPLHRWRFLKRRYNQAGLLADALGQKTNLPVDHQSLIRHKRTTVQGSINAQNKHLKGKERRKANVKNAFSIPYPATIQGKNILLIDDVFTTGSTLSECARILKKAGSGSVHVLTAARVIKGD
jgi:ComF family protein